jgi:hypothetical protein
MSVHRRRNLFDMSTRSRVAGLTAAALLLLTAAIPVAQAADPPPAYDVTFLGNGTPVAINDTGTIAGTRLVGTSGYEALVSVGGASWTVLPKPAGADTTFPTDVNDAGVIVGNAYTSGNSVGVRWLPGPGGYTVEVLPRLAGDPSSYATGIDNLGRIVGARRSLGYVPAATSGWLWSPAGGVVDLAAVYGLWAAPTDLNTDGMVISSTEVLDLATGTRSDIGLPAPTGYNAVASAVLNEAGQVGGTAVMSSQSLNIVAAFRYTPGSGWTYLAGTTRYTVVTSINDLGDVGYGEQGAGIAFADLGVFPVWRLLSADATAAGWTITGGGTEINHGRAIATVGRNTVTGQAGGVLLTPRGTVQPPAAPVLTGVPHPSTPDAPWNAISLSWTRIPDATGYLVERRDPGTTAFRQVSNGTTIQTIYDDTAITAGATYTYRVFAVGLLTSAPSNEITVTAPSTAADTQAPVVTILTPAPNTIVSGIVRVQATATDNTGVVRMELRNAAGKILASSASGSLVYDWNTRSLKRGSTQTLTVRALDAAGNAGTAQVVVRIRR